MRITFKLLATLILILSVAGLVLLGLNFYNNIPLRQLTDKWTYPDSKYMSLAGMNVHYRVKGSGEPIVLLHGTGSSLHTWEVWTDLLAQDYKVVSLDLPGFGLTGKHFLNDYSIRAYVNFLDIFLDKLKVEDIILVGNSLGGNIAWHYALDHTARVKKLVLIDASGFPKEDDALPFYIAKTPFLNQVMLKVSPKRVIADYLKEQYYEDNKVTDALVSRYHDLLLREGNRQAFIDRAQTPFEDRTDELNNISQATLILWGRHDTATPLTWARRFEEQIPNAQLIIFENAGHLPMEEIPQSTAQTLIDFIEKDTL